MASEVVVDERYPVNAPGWAAIDRRVGAIHPQQTPHQFTSDKAYDLEQSSPLPAITVWEGIGPAHWHYVTYGLTELFDKTSQRPELSGFGYELTFRLARHDGETQPPTWPLRLLQAVGHYVLSGHGSLDSGHVLDLGGPIVPDTATGLTGLLCVPDSQLGKFESEHGSVLFLQLFGLMQAELETLNTWELERKVGLVREVSPLAITDPLRSPLRDDARTGPIFRRYELKVLLE